MKKLYISCVADDEVRVVGEDNVAAQKLLSEDERADPVIYWTPRWVRELVSYLVTCKYLQERYRSHINFLIWTAFRSPELPDHAELVRATKMLLAKWTVDCSRDDTCLAPPSRRMLADNEIRKVLTSYAEMKTAILESTKGNDNKLESIKTGLKSS
jgi:hypothetical protein